MQYEGFLFGSIAGFLSGMFVQGVFLTSPKEDPRKYVIHPVENREDAIKKIQEAYDVSSFPTHKIMRFKRNGRLVQKVMHPGKKGRPTMNREINRYVSFKDFYDGSVLQIQVYEDKKQKKPLEEGMALHRYFSNLK